MGTVPTKMVVVKSSGQKVLINVEDFDAKIHADFVEEPEKKPDETPQAPFNISATNVNEALEIIASFENPDELQALLDEEVENKNRKKVIAAIEDRIKELGG